MNESLELFLFVLLQAQEALFTAKGIANNYNVKEENMTKLAEKAKGIADE